jgi:hypothetical protein
VSERQKTEEERERERESVVCENGACDKVAPNDKQRASWATSTGSRTTIKTIDSEQLRWRAAEKKKKKEKRG